jgi:hypothetical protein
MLAMAQGRRTWDAIILSDPKQLLTVIQAGLSLAVLFGLNLSVEQMAGIVGFLSTVVVWLNSQQPTPKDLSDFQEAADRALRAKNTELDETKRTAAAALEAHER